MKIYGIPFSAHTRKVIVAAIRKKLEYSVVPVVPVDPDQVPPNWSVLSPLGKIPALEDGDVMLADSSVICAYLERKYPETALYPAAPQDYGRALWLEEYVDGSLQADVLHGVFFENVIRPKLFAQKTDQAKVDDVIANKLPPKFSYLNEQVKGRFLVDDVFSIADITVASILVNFQYAGGVLDGDRYPRLETYFRGMLEEDALRKALEAEAPFAEKMGLERKFLRGIVN